MTRSNLRIGLIAAAVVFVGTVAYGVAHLPPAVMTGVIAVRGAASVTAHDQLGASTSLVVDSVTAPDRSWLVAYRVGMEGMSGALLGYVQVPAGTSKNVTIPIDTSIRLTPQAIIVLNADRGVPGRFEFAMNRFEGSTDKPYYVAGHAVQTTITVALPENGDTFEIPAPVTP